MQGDRLSKPRAESQPSAIYLPADRWRLSAFGDEIAPDLETQLAVLARHGVGHLELRAAWGSNIVDLGPQRLARAGHLLREARVGVSAIGSPVGKSEIEAGFEPELDRVRSALDAAERLDTGLVRVFSFFIPDGNYAQHRDEVLRRMAALAKEARRREITLVHENESYIYGDTPERCLDLVASVGSPALRGAFDPANFVQVGIQPYPDAWNQLAPTVAHFHVKDAVAVDRAGSAAYPARVEERRLMESVRLPGAGSGGLPELLRELQRSGYRGFLTIEPHLQAHLPELDPPDRFAAAVAALRDLIAGLDGG